MCFGSACPDLHLPIPADSQILTPSTRPAVVTHTVMLPARRSACKIPSLENRHVWLSTAQSSPGPPNLALIAIMLPNLRNACQRTASIAGQSVCCYSMVPMAKKKTKLDKAVERTSEIIQAHLDTLPVPRAKAMRKDLHRLAVKSSRSASRGTASRSPRSANPRPLSRASAKPA